MNQGVAVARKVAWSLFLVASLLPIGACTDARQLGTTITVAAASSLTDAFNEFARIYERETSNHVRFTFAGSSALSQQIIQGAPVDVFVSADEANMQRVAGLVSSVKMIARNRLALIVEAGNPKQITGIGDLDRADVQFVMCAPQVPCGTFSERALKVGEISAQPRSLEQSVKGVVSRVTLGEVDVGIVYESDALAARELDTVHLGIPSTSELEALYPAAVVDSSSSKAAGARFIELLLSERGQAVLRSYGFLPA